MVRGMVDKEIFWSSFCCADNTGMHAFMQEGFSASTHLGMWLDLEMYFSSFLISHDDVDGLKREFSVTIQSGCEYCADRGRRRTQKAMTDHPECRIWTSFPPILDRLKRAWHYLRRTSGAGAPGSDLGWSAMSWILSLSRFDLCWNLSEYAASHAGQLRYDLVNESVDES